MPAMWIFILTPIVMLFGLFSLIAPIYPGQIIMWLAALFSGLFYYGLAELNWFLFSFMTILVVVATFIQNAQVNAKVVKYGASKRSILLTLVIAVFFSLFLSPVGGLFFAPLWLYFFEIGNGHSGKEAWGITRGLMTDWSWAFVVRFGLGVVMIVLWLFMV